MADVAYVVAYVIQKHVGQVDKAGKPYFLHLFRVAGAMETQEEILTALLHDILEDTDATVEELRDELGMSRVVLEAVKALTRQEDEAYQTFIFRCALNSLARRVKIADVRDHLRDTSCLSDSHALRYEVALDYLEKVERGG